MKLLTALILGATGVALVAPQAVYGQTDSPSIVSRVREATALYASPDSAGLRRFIRLRPISRVPGLNPFVGEHWFRPAFLRLQALDLSKPGYLMYYPVGGVEQLVGVGYAFNQPAGAAPPDDLAGAHPHWHLHFPCVELPGIGSLLLGSSDECRELSGKPGDSQIAMVHVWLVRNPDGVFGSENPALPFLATGLTPPDSVALANHEQSTRLRTLSLALGETIGARPRYGTMSEFGADSLKFRRRAEPLRARISLLADSLRATERRGDRSGYEVAVTQAIAVEDQLKQLYLDLAPRPVARTLIERWFEAVLSPSSHHPGH